MVLSYQSQGKALYVPKIMKEDDRMRFLRVYDESDLTALPAGTWGIKEPDLQRHGVDRVDGTWSIS